MRLKQILEREVDMARMLMASQGKINPMIAVHGYKEILCFPLTSSDYRKEARAIMDKIKEMKNFDYAVFMAEAWEKTYPKDFDLESIRHGDLQKAAEEGDSSIKEILMIQVFRHGEKLAAMFDIIDKKLENMKVFDKFNGYLDFEGQS